MALGIASMDGLWKYPREKAGVALCPRCCAPDPEPDFAIPPIGSRAEEVLPPTHEPSAISALAEERATFVANLTRDTVEVPWGIFWDRSGGSVIHVTEVVLDEGSPVLSYNATVPEDSQVKDGDYIVGVNELFAANIVCEENRTPADTLGEELRNSTTVTLHVRRPLLFTCEVNKRSDGLGLMLTYTGSSYGLSVTDVAEVAAKNIVPEIHAGDRIVAVDGKRGTPLELLEMIKRSRTPVLIVSRPY